MTSRIVSTISAPQKKPIAVFDEVVNVKVRSSSNRVVDLSPRKVRLRIDNTSTKDGQKAYVVEVFDERRVDLVYRLQLTRADFDALRKVQRINPDFDNLLDLVVGFVRSTGQDDWVEVELDDDSSGGCSVNLMHRSHFSTNCELKLPLVRVRGDDLVRYLISHISQLTSTHSRTVDERNSLRQAVKDISESRDAYRTEAEDLRKKLENLSAEKNELEVQYNRIHQELADLQCDFTSKKDESDLRLVVISRQKEEIESLQGEIQNLQVELEEIDDEGGQLKERLDAKSAEVQSLLHEKQRLASALSEITNKGQRREREVYELRGLLAKEVALTKEVESERDAAVAALEESEKNAQIFAGKVEELMTRVGQLEDHVESQKVQIDIKSRLADDLNRRLRISGK